MSWWIFLVILKIWLVDRGDVRIFFRGNLMVKNPSFGQLDHT
jgi:hypothetical protein